MDYDQDIQNIQLLSSDGLCCHLNIKIWWVSGKTVFKQLWFLHPSPFDRRWDYLGALIRSVCNKKMVEVVKKG